jgi:AAA family ATP:ADP antiporter
MSEQDAPTPPSARGWDRVARFVDVRRDELPLAVRAFSALLLIISAHTIVETARDALLITRLPPRALGIVYVTVAACVLPAAAIVSRVSARIGTRWALGLGLGVGAVGMIALFSARTTETSVVTLYAASGLVGGVLVPQFWSLVGSLFTATQARRLLGPIAAAGVLGGTLGSGGAAALLSVLPVKALLLVSAGLMSVASLVILMGRRPELPGPSGPPAARIRQSPEMLRAEPFLRRIALLVVASTATALAVDYFFKWSVAQSVAPEHVARFVARYYLGLNVMSLVAQLLVSGLVVRRMGVATAVVLTPLLFATGAVGVIVAGGVLVSVLILRAVDGALINSLHRVTSELVYLPISPVTRARAKPILDGALARSTQAACGVAFLVSASVMSPTRMALVAGALAVAWLAVAMTTRRPYLDLLRRAIPSLRPELEQERLDLDGATELVQLLAHPDPRLVIGAIDVLERRGRPRLVPALVLVHEHESVLLRGLSLFAPSDRQDWLPRARRLLSHDSIDVRIAAARALAQHGQLDLDLLSRDESPRMQGYVAVHASLRRQDVDPAEDPRIVELLERQGDDGEAARLGVLGAIADAKRDRRFIRLLLALAERAVASREWTEGVSRAAISQQAMVLIPDLVARLPLREGRETLRDALVALGQRAFSAVSEALLDGKRERSLRVHLPNTVSRFGTRAAADLLLSRIEEERDGLVRYKCIRGLQRLVTANPVRLDRRRVEKLALANANEHFRVIGLRAAFGESAEREPTQGLLVRLLDDKIRQSLERAFRLLQIAHPFEDIARVEVAVRSPDPRVRANALEFVDALLSRRDQRLLSELLRTACEDVPLGTRWSMASRFLSSKAPQTVSEAVEWLVSDGDETVRALAELHRATLAGQPKRVAIKRGLGTRSPVELENETRVSSGDVAHG